MEFNLTRQLMIMTCLKISQIIDFYYVANSGEVSYHAS